MFNLIFLTEFVRITLIVGAIYSLFFKKIFGYTPGAIIAPVFLVLALELSWLWFLVLTLISLFLYLIYFLFFSQRALSSRLITSGLVFASVVLSSASFWLLKDFLNLEFKADSIVGIVVPGLIASSFVRNKIPKTLLGLMSVTALTYATVVLIEVLTVLFPIIDISSIDSLRAGRQVLEVPYYFVQIILSSLITFLAFYFFKLRVGGYIMLPTVATLFLVSPINFVIFVCLAVILYFLVNQVLSKFTLLYGLNRFVLVLILATMMVWILEYLILLNTTSFSPLLLTPIIVPIALSVWVNDMSVQGFRKSILPFSLVTFVGVLISYGFSHFL